MRMRTLLTTLSRKQWLQLAVISFVLAFCCVFGTSYTLGEGFASLPLPAEIGLTVLAMVPFAAFLLFSDWALAKIRQSSSKRPAVFKVLFLRHPSRTAFAIMLLCWLPWLVANFPGSTYWDTYWQMWQVYPEAHPVALIQWAPVRDSTLTDAWLVDHHPVLTTLVFGGAAWLSDQLTGNWMAGVFVLSTLQVLGYLALFTHLLSVFQRWNTPRVVRLALFVFFCLMPAVPTWASCVVKDSLFGLAFIPWFLMLVECLRTQGGNLSGRNVALFTMLALLMCLTKKTGIFIVLITTVICCLLFRKRIRLFEALALQGASCFIVMVILMPLVVFPLANIAPGGAQETLGLLFQQTARYAQVHDLSQDEECIINAVVNVERVKDHYQFDFQDGVKYYYQVRSSQADLVEYLKLYAMQGLEDPEAYFAAIMSQAGMYVAPTTFLNIRMVTVDTKIGKEDRPVLWNPDELDGLRECLDAAYGTIASVPVVNTPFLTVLYVLWLPAALLFSNLRRKRGLGALFVPVGVMVGFCVIAPVFDARYVWPLLLAFPLLLGAMTASETTRIEYGTPGESEGQNENFMASERDSAVFPRDAPFDSEGSNVLLATSK